MNNRCTELQQNKSQIHSNGLFDNNYYIPKLVKDILKTKLNLLLWLDKSPLIWQYLKFKKDGTM